VALVAFLAVVLAMYCVGYWISAPRYHWTIKLGRGEAAEFAQSSNPRWRDPGLAAAHKTRNEMRALLVKRPELAQVKKNLRGRIREGDNNQVVYASEILRRRAILTKRYKLPHKVLSNFAHFLTLSHSSIMDTTGDWHKSWREFFLASLSVATFLAEGLKTLIETFPDTASLLSDKEQRPIENYRGWLRDEMAEPK